MTKIKFPKIFEYDDGHNYLRDFFNLNQSISPHVSHRYIARLLKWPSSYLGDVLAKRRPLTMSRALQFAKWAKLDVFETERLVFLVLKENKEKAVSEYFSANFESKQNPQLKITEEIREELYSDIDYQVVFNILAWSRRLLDGASVSRLIPSFPDLTSKKADKIIAELIEKKMLTFDSQKHLIGIADFYADYPISGEETALIHRGYTENTLRSWMTPIKPRYYFQGFMCLPKSRFGEVRARMLMLRNWLIELESECASKPDENADNTLFQFDLNLFAIIRDSDTNMET